MKFFGKHEGNVVNNEDPEELGRLQVSVPSVLGTRQLSWARPCVPYAGANIGFYMMPPKGTSVWVEFMNGDLNYPIWSGCYWKPGELPAGIKPTSHFIKTQTGGLIIEEDKGKGSLILSFQSSTKPPITLKFDANAIELKYLAQMKISFTSEGIDLENSNTSVHIGQNEITLTQGISNVIKISNTGGININNGALEVI